MYPVGVSTIQAQGGRGVTGAVILDLGGHAERGDPFRRVGINAERRPDEVRRLVRGDRDRGQVVTLAETRVIRLVRLGDEVRRVDDHLDVNRVIGSDSAQRQGGEAQERLVDRGATLSGQEAGGDGGLPEQDGRDPFSPG